MSTRHSTIQMLKPFFITFLFLSLDSNSTGYNDWQSNIDESCNAKAYGRLSTMFSKSGFWFETAVSMDMWADDMRIEKPEDYCKIDYYEHKNQVKYLQCIAYIRKQWDWYERCIPIVNIKVRQK